MSDLLKERPICKKIQLPRGVAGFQSTARTGEHSASRNHHMLLCGMPYLIAPTSTVMDPPPFSTVIDPKSVESEARLKVNMVLLTTLKLVT